MASQKTKSLVRILMIVLLAPMIAIGSEIYQTYIGIQDAKSNYNKSSIEVRSLEWLSIESIITENVDKANMQSSYIKKDVYENLLSAYSGDMAGLKQDLHNDSASKAYDVMNTAIGNVYLNNKTENNRVFIADRNGVIVDKGYKSSNKNSRLWSSEIESKPNSELASAAIESIINKENTLTFWQVKSSNTPVTVVSMDNLKEVFKNDGLQGLASFDILAPTYITDNEDIFGMPDVNSHGYKIDNDKLIVIQEFNIYDAVISHRELISSYCSLEDNNEFKLKSTISGLVRNMVVSIAIMILAFIGILSSAVVCIKWSNDNANRRSNKS